jgi:hypothetical protein
MARKDLTPNETYAALSGSLPGVPTVVSAARSHMGRRTVQRHWMTTPLFHARTAQLTF